MYLIINKMTSSAYGDSLVRLIFLSFLRLKHTVIARGSANRPFYFMQAKSASVKWSTEAVMGRESAPYCTKTLSLIYLCANALLYIHVIKRSNIDI